MINNFKKYHGTYTSQKVIKKIWVENITVKHNRNKNYFS